MTKKNTTVHLISLGILCVGFLLCRYVFFSLHRMKDWPLYLFLFGLLVLGISFFAKARQVPVATSLSYIIGFAAGLLFQTKGTDPGGGTTNSLWTIWTVAVVCTVVLAVIIEAVQRKGRGEPGRQS